MLTVNRLWLPFPNSKPAPVINAVFQLPGRYSYTGWPFVVLVTISLGVPGINPIPADGCIFIHVLLLLVREQAYAADDLLQLLLYAL
jgi:hypothetical protein